MEIPAEDQQHSNMVIMEISSFSCSETTLSASGIFEEKDSYCWDRNRSTSHNFGVANLLNELVTPVKSDINRNITIQPYSLSI